MHQGGDYNYTPPQPPYYNYTPATNLPPPTPQDYPSTPLPPPFYASAPPFTTSDYPSYPQQNYPSTPHFPDHNPPPPPQQQQYQTTSYYDSPNYPPPNPNPNYASQYDNSGYFEENLSGYANYGSNKSNLGSGYENYSKDDEVYAYEGKNEPYGARGTTNSKSNSNNSSNWSGLFDDYGRPISFPKEEKEKERKSSSNYSGSGSGGLKVVRAVPKVEDKSDGKSGVQKFRVKLLPESGGQGILDVLCMVICTLC